MTAPEPTLRDRAILSLACCGSFVVILDATIVSVALPDIRSALDMTTSALPWTVNAYTLAFAGFLLVGGRLSDRYGQRRVFMLGMIVFTLARAAAGLADATWLLLTARAVQGLGGALLMPVTLSLLTTRFTTATARAKALGTWSAVGAVAAASGPVIGGILTQWTGWRSVFLVSLPVGVAAAVAGARLPRATATRDRSRVDVVGATIATTALVATVYAVMRSATVGWADASVLLPLAGGLALLGLFLWHQAGWARDPLVPLGIFRSRAVSSGNIVMFLLGLGFFASPILLSLYLQDVHGYSPFGAGMAYLPIGVAMFLGAQSAGRLSVRIGARRASVWCCGIATVGFAGVTAVAAARLDQPLWMLLPGVVFGFGAAASFTPVTVVATSSVPSRHNGVAAGLLNTVRQTSGAIGLGVLSTVTAVVGATWRAAHPRYDAATALAHGYTAAFAVSAGCLLVAAVAAAWAMPRR